MSRKPTVSQLGHATGQPDLAHLVIDYVPGNRIVKSKLYLGLYRNHGAFHEDCTVRIGMDLKKLLSPKWLRIAGNGIRAAALP